MIYSMTGFGRGEASDDARKITVELKSVNHRYLDINVKMPHKLLFFDTAVRQAIKDRIHRGKVDVFVSYEDLSESDLSVRYNREIAASYLARLREMAEDFSLDDDIRVSTLSRYPEVFTMEEQPVDDYELWTLLAQALNSAMDLFVEVRAREGAQLRADLAEKLDNMLINVKRVEERAPGIMSEYREKLKQKVEELLGNTQIDESRIATEIVLFSDKMCTDEETVRLRSHIVSMKDTLDAEDDVGRKIDFIAQEMNREANTILSKANDLQTSDIAIELKTEIEKIREQVQNIE